MFLLYFAFAFVFATFVKYTKESERAHYIAYFLIKRAVFAIFLISFAYINMEAQLALLVAIQFGALWYEIIMRPEKNLLNRLLSLVTNIVLLTFICLMFMFLDDNPSNTDVQGAAAAIFAAVYILVYATVIIVYGVVRLILSYVKPELQKRHDDDFSEISYQQNNHNESEHQPQHQLIKKNSMKSDHHPADRSSKEEGKSDEDTSMKDSKNKNKNGRLSNLSRRSSRL